MEFVTIETYGRKQVFTKEFADSMSYNALELKAYLHYFEQEKYEERMPMYAERAILEKLKELQKNVPDPNHGICMNLDILLNNNIDGSNHIMKYFDEWFGNKSAYPVEGKAESNTDNINKVGYLNNPKKWDISTKFGKKRHELLQRLIDTYKQLVK